MVLFDKRSTGKRHTSQCNKESSRRLSFGGTYYPNIIVFFPKLKQNTMNMKSIPFPYKCCKLHFLHAPCQWLCEPPMASSKAAVRDTIWTWTCGVFGHPMHTEPSTAAKLFSPGVSDSISAFHMRKGFRRCGWEAVQETVLYSCLQLLEQAPLQTLSRNWKRLPLLWFPLSLFAWEGKRKRDTVLIRGHSYFPDLRHQGVPILNNLLERIVCWTIFHLHAARCLR